MANKNVFLICSGLCSPFFMTAQVIYPPAPLEKGFERTIRTENNWQWGTLGHGSFEDAIQLFKAEKKVMTYENGLKTYRVFSIGNHNFVEVNYGINKGTYAYTTKTSSTSTYINPPANMIAPKKEPEDNYAKVIRKKGNWDWGTFDHGTFDQAAALLGETKNIVTLRDPFNGKINYRLFSHGSLNFVEIDYGWKGGIFTYTTFRGSN